MTRRHFVVLVIILGVVGITLIGNRLFAAPSQQAPDQTTAADYDVNRNGYIDKYEAQKGIRDYLKYGNISRDDAVDLFLSQYVNRPLPGATPPAARATPLPTLTPTPRPTATPRPIVTPVPTATPVYYHLRCLNRTAGTIFGKKEVGNVNLRDMEAVFINPEEGYWEYGFWTTWIRVHSTYFSSLGGIHQGLKAVVTSNGQWLLMRPNKYNQDVVLDFGWFEDEGIPFNHQPGGWNLLYFTTDTEQNRHRLFVNNVEVPLDFGWFTDEYKIVGGINANAAFAKDNTDRKDYLLGTTGTSGTRYEGFCRGLKR